jgi:hypothetical protein
MQSIFYKEVVPITKEKHSNLAVKTGNDYKFANKANSVPVTVNEFSQAAREYPLVFIENDDSVMPVAVLGLEQDQNLYVTEDGKWQGQYIPAFVRRYPFIFALDEDESRFTLCIDEHFSGCNQEGLGERLFDTEGEETQYLKGILNFLQTYQAQFKSTQQLSQRLKELNLLESMQLRINAEEGQPLFLSGFLAVSRDQLQRLSGEQLIDLMQLGLLELIYVHLQSMNNFSNLVELRTSTP